MRFTLDVVHLCAYERNVERKMKILKVNALDSQYQFIKSSRLYLILTSACKNKNFSELYMTFYITKILSIYLSAYIKSSEMSYVQVMIFF